MNKSHFIGIFVSAVILLAALIAPRLHFVEDFSSYNLISKEQKKEIANFQGAFVTGEAQSILLYENKKSWSTANGMAQLKTITDSLAHAFPSIVFTSVTNISFPVRLGWNYSQKALIDWEHPEETKMHFQDVYSKFISENDRYALIYTDATELSDHFLTYAESLVAEQDHLIFHYFDVSSFQHELSEQSRSNLWITGLLSLLFIMLSFYLFARSLKALLLIVLFTVFNLACLLCIIWITGVEITPHLTTLPSLIAVLSFSDVLHIVYHHVTIRPAHDSISESRSALQKSLRSPLLLTSVTNAVGFVIYLLFSVNAYFVELSWIACTGVLIAYLSARFLVIYFLDRPDGYLSLTIVNKLQRNYDLLQKKLHPRKKGVSLIFILLLIFLSFFVAKSTSLNTIEDSFVSDDADIAKTQQLLANHFFGNKQLTIAIYVTSGALTDQKVIEKCQELEVFTNELFNPFYTDNYLNVIRRYNRTMARGNWNAFKLYGQLHASNRSFKALKKALGWNSVVSTDAQSSFISIGYLSTSLEDRLAKYEALEQKINSLSDETVQFEIKSEHYYQDLTEVAFVKIVITGFLIAFLLAGLLVRRLNGSWLKSLFFILVNVFPLLFALMMMSVLNVPLNSLSIFMLSILVGLCLDDSIYLISFRNNLRPFGSIFPIVVTSIVLGLGMLGFWFSSYQWLQPFSWIFLSSFFVSLLTDIMVLPLFMNDRNNASE